MCKNWNRSLMLLCQRSSNLQGLHLSSSKCSSLTTSQGICKVSWSSKARSMPIITRIISKCSITSKVWNRLPTQNKSKKSLSFKQSSCFMNGSSNSLITHYASSNLQTNVMTKSLHITPSLLSTYSWKIATITTETSKSALRS